MYERPISTRIIQELDYFCDLVAGHEFEKATWTAGVKNALLRAGRHFGYQINTTIRVDYLPEELREAYEAPDYGEWLYDVSICDVAQSEHWCTPVVAECEWCNRNYIKEDFDKLLVARAGLRVMVYQDRFVAADTLRHWVDLHEGSHAGDTYLLVAYQDAVPNEPRLLYRRITVRTSAAELVDVGGE